MLAGKFRQPTENGLNSGGIECQSCFKRGPTPPKIRDAEFDLHDAYNPANHRHQRRLLQRNNPRLTLIRMSFVPRRIPYTCTAPEPALELLGRDLARRTFGICSLCESSPA